jgi:hypothetical protein
MKITEFIEQQKPVDVAKALGTKQQTSTRDKERLIKKAKNVAKRKTNKKGENKKFNQRNTNKPRNKISKRK